MFILAGRAISWKSTKQTIIASSSMEVKFVLCFKGTVHGLWLKNFILWFEIFYSISFFFFSFFLRNFYSISWSLIIYFNYSNGAKYMAPLKFFRVQMKHCYREANHCVDWLAKFGAKWEQDFVIHDSPPLNSSS